MRIRARLVTVAIVTMSTIAALPQVTHSDTARADSTGRDVGSAIAAQHNGYVVKGKKLSADIARAVVAVERCEAVSGVAACDALLTAEHELEVALVRRGRAALDASEPVSTDTTYATVPVAVIPQGDSTLVYTVVPVSESPLAKGQTIATTAPLVRLGAFVGHRSPLSHAHDGGNVNITEYGCDFTWCYGHGSVVYSPSGAGWHLNFDFDLKVSLDPSGQVWGSNWRVTGGALFNQSWSNFAYSNSANSAHTEEWPIAYGTINFSAGGGYTSHTVEIHCDLTANSATWYGVTN